MKGQKRSVFLRFLRYFLTFAVGNGITKKFFDLVIQLPWEGNGITIRLVILLPTRKNFGNPILLGNKQGGKNQNADLAK
ncbi:MAG: hypothetical protein KIG54_06250 [Bacteroidales bacterium]|nr:hypothetical protein [Bacteroidales bacterium]